MALDRQRMAVNLTRLRKEKRWTQEQLEEESGISERTISRIEAPKPGDMEKEIRYSTIERLAKALGCDPDDITGGADLAQDPPAETPDLIGHLASTEATKILRRLDEIEAKINGLALEFDYIKLADALRAALADAEPVPRTVSPKPSRAKKRAA